MLSSADSEEALTSIAKPDSSYDKHKLIELGVNPEFLKFMNDVQAKELVKGLLYLIAKKQDGFA